MMMYRLKNIFLPGIVFSKIAGTINLEFNLMKITDHSLQLVNNILLFN